MIYHHINNHTQDMIKAMRFNAHSLFVCGFDGHNCMVIA